LCQCLKSDGSIRICTDAREPNKAIKRERYSIPTCDDLIYKLNGCKVFSKIDLRAGYHQLEFDPRSRHVTTLSTHIGNFRYKRLNFSINTAAEIFQRKIEEIISDIELAINVSDDIIVGG
jgi:hypothetical protein